MALAHVTKLYGVVDGKIAKLTADPAGGSATYGSLIDVPGIKTIAITGTVDTKQLRGDNAKLDQFSVLSDISATVTHAKISLDAFAVMVGGAVADTGTTPNQKATYDLLGTDSMNYFKLEGVTPLGGVDVVGGDFHYVLHKLILTAYPEEGFAEEDYKIISFTASASPRIADSKWIQKVFNETAAAIA